MQNKLEISTVLLLQRAEALMATQNAPTTRAKCLKRKAPAPEVDAKQTTRPLLQCTRRGKKSQGNRTEADSPQRVGKTICASRDKIDALPNSTKQTQAQNSDNKMQLDHKFTIFDSINVLRALRTRSPEEVATVLYHCPVKKITDISVNKRIITKSYMRQLQNRVIQYFKILPGTEQKLEYLNNCMYSHLQRMRLKYVDFLGNLTDEVFIANARKLNAHLDISWFVPNAKWLQCFKSTYRIKTYSDLPKPADSAAYLDDRYIWAKIVHTTKVKQYKLIGFNGLLSNVTLKMIHTACGLDLIKKAIAIHVRLLKEDYSTRVIDYGRALPVFTLRLCDILSISFDKIKDWLHTFIGMQGMQQAKEATRSGSITPMPLDVDLYYILDLCITEEETEKETDAIDWTMQMPSTVTPIVKQETISNTKESSVPIQEQRQHSEASGKQMHIKEEPADTAVPATLVANVKQEIIDEPEEFIWDTGVAANCGLLQHVTEKLAESLPIGNINADTVVVKQEPIEDDDFALLNEQSQNNTLFEEFVKEEPILNDAIEMPTKSVGSTPTRKNSQIQADHGAKPSIHKITSNKKAKEHLHALMAYASNKYRPGFLTRLLLLDSVLLGKAETVKTLPRRKFRK